MMEQKFNQLYSKLAETSLLAFECNINQERQERLDYLADFIANRLKEELPVNLSFICTHNSRRSQLSQAWASVAAFVYNLPIKSYSGGTEVTAFNERAVQTLIEAGFQFSKTSDGENPHYEASWSKEDNAALMFSKVYNDAANPAKDFIAVMTCTHAEQNCPLIPETLLRFSLPFTDPKESDNTPQERETYRDRSTQIAGEMFLLFAKVFQKIA